MLYLVLVFGFLTIYRRLPDFSLLQHKVRDVLVNNKRYTTRRNDSREVRFQSLVKSSPTFKPRNYFSDLRGREEKKK